MSERIATIASSVGLHVRPAAIFAVAVADSDLEITIAMEGELAEVPMDADSMLSLMSLGAAHGDRVVLHAEGPGAEEALGALVVMLETDHGA